MRRGLVAANWKMNGSRAQNERLLDQVLQGLEQAGLRADDCELLVFPPSVYLEQVGKRLKATFLGLGAQNVYPRDQGAFTGEISAAMLADFACSHVLVGHSERRELFAESDDWVADKFLSVRARQLTPVLCVGESLAQREGGETESTVLGQLDAVREKAGIEAFAGAVLAYEPVWAIGTGRSAGPEQAQAVHAMIRSYLADADKSVAESVRILYGGSVKADNAAALFAMPDIDGALVGGASLEATEFVAICRAMKDMKEAG